MTAEDKLIEFHTTQPGPHSTRRAAEYTGMSHMWCHTKWAEIRERQEETNKFALESWRTAQLHDIARAKVECYEILDDKEATSEDRVAAVKALMACVDREIKLTGTARPVQVQILEGNALEEFMKNDVPADLLARVQAADPKAMLEVKAMMLARKAGG